MKLSMRISPLTAANARVACRNPGDDQPWSSWPAKLAVARPKYLHSTRGSRNLARELPIKDIGYDQDNFHWAKSEVQVHVASAVCRISRKALMRLATRTKAPATRASCLVTPALRQRMCLMPAPIHLVASVFLKDDGDQADKSGDDCLASGPDSQKPGHVSSTKTASRSARRLLLFRPSTTKALSQDDDPRTRASDRRRRPCPMAGCALKTSST